MSATIAGANLNFGRDPKAQLADVAELEANAEIVITQEDVTGGNRERIRLHPHVQRDGRGSLLATLDRHGFRIMWRRFRWVDVDLPGIGMIRVVCAHIAPRRMPLLQKINARRLRRLLRRSPHPWIVEADWNHFLRNDPCELKARLGAHWYGDGIDGFAVHPRLAEHVLGCIHEDQPQRKDGHPFVYLTLGPAPKKEHR